MEMKPLRCDRCGQFVSYEAIENGQAITHLLTPDSEYTTESYVTLCSVRRKLEQEHPTRLSGWFRF